MSRVRPRVIPWVRDGLCHEYPQDWWFPPQGQNGTDAKEVCRRCLVRAECLAYAIDAHEKVGIWGGFAHHELEKWQRPQVCPGCHQRIPVAEVTAFIIKGTERRSWICRRCRHREIQARKRA